MRRALDAADAFVGGRVEEAVRNHHRRRLSRVGWEHALDPLGDGGWAEGDPAPRAGCALDVLVDGAEALPRIVELVESARERVEVAGWYVTPGFRLGPGGPTVRELLAEAAERVEVRVLVWAGAPLPLFTPDRRLVRRTLDELTRGTRIRAAADANERPMHCHHEKLVVVDGETAVLGGIDLTSLAGDRWDTSEHRFRDARGWHDAACVLRGPVVGDVAQHVAIRWREVTGEELPAPAPEPDAGALELQLVRTVPEHVHDAVPDGDFRILESYRRAIRSAERLVYLESQFLWSPELVADLAAKLREPPSDEFRVVVVLPAVPQNGADDTRGQLGELTAADAGHGRLLACSLWARGESRACPVYVHAKIGVVDDRWLSLGSANLNEHSLFNDTEANVVVHDSKTVRATRLRLWAEHLELPVEHVDGDPTRVIDDLWRPIAEEQLARRARGLPLTHRLVRLPHTSRRSRRLLGPLQSLLVDG